MSGASTPPSALEIRRQRTAKRCTVSPVSKLLVRAIGRVGSDHHGLQVIEVDRLCAWVDRAPVETADRAAVLRHHAVVEALGDCLPARFGTLVDDEASLVEMLRARQQELLARLDSVAGRRELAVTGLWTAAEPVESTEGGPGRRFMEQRRARARRAEDARRIAEELASAAGVSDQDARHMLTPSVGVAFSSALLVPAEDAAEIKSRLEQSRPSDVRILVHGPWPPYTFAE
jgi:hypothetical protein